MLELNPGVILIVGALLMPILPHVARGLLGVLLPLLALYHLISLPRGELGTITLFDLQLVTLRIDDLSFPFAIVFLIAAVIAAVYSLHVRGWVQHMSQQMYAGAAIAAVLAGDLVTLFVFWEITAITSVFLIWAIGSERAYNVGMRYLIVQVGSGVLLLAGVMMHAQANGSIAFDTLAKITVSGTGDVPLSAWLMLIGIGVKAAFPILHAWLPDAYPEATPTGAVWLSAFTTKLAIYTLARGYPGSDLLIPIGAVMVIFPLVFAMVADDLRRVLSYALINQLGFMVIGVGIGTELAIAGVAANAFGHVIYKSLLFMALGAVLLQTGTAKASALGGLHRTMPITVTCGVLAMLSISVPLFSGYVAKTLIMSAAMKHDVAWLYLLLLFGSVGVFVTAGIRVAYEAYFRTPTAANATRDQAGDPPWNMQLAMALGAVVSIAVGLNPSALYAILPGDISYPAYKPDKVLAQLQILLFAALGFALMVRFGLYRSPVPSRVTDADWFYRTLGYNIASTLLLMLAGAWKTISEAGSNFVNYAEQSIGRTHNPDGILGRTWSPGFMAFVATLMLAVYLLIFYAREFSR